MDMATAFGRATGSITSGVVTLVGLATIAAWLIERSGARIAYLERWRVKDLKVLDLAAWDLSALRDSARAGSRTPWAPRRYFWRSSPTARGLSEIAIAAVLGLWWVGALRFDFVGSWDDLRELGVDPDGLVHTDWASLKAALLPPGLIYCAGLATLGGVRLFRPSAARILGAMDLGIALWVLAVTAWVWLASPLAAYVQGGSVTGMALHIKMAIDHGFTLTVPDVLTLCLIFTAMGAIGRATRGLWTMGAGAH